MNPENLLRIDTFDLRKLSKTCNYRDCKKLPTKQAVILETDSKSTREIVDLYFCAEHYNRNIRTIMEKLNALSEKGKFIEKKVFDIGYITY
jgi:hypothetical protein